MALIEVDGITKVYPMAGGDVHALRGVSFSIEAGEMVSVVGSSGSGKTTLLYLLGLLTDPDGGRYQLAGKEVSRLSDVELARIRAQEIGFVFQSFNLLPQLSVLDNVLMSARYSVDPKRFKASSAKETASQLLDRVGLKSRLSHRPRELSGGEMQRVAIARALLTEPSVILADEPTGNLDEENSDQVFGILKDLAASGTTVILVTHDLSLAAKTDRSIRLRDGEVDHEDRSAA